MICLLHKHEIISVPSYTEGIYHRTKCDIISKIYHPFCRNGYYCKKHLPKQVLLHGGAGGNRNRVRKSVLTAFYECSLSFGIPPTERR